MPAYRAILAATFDAASLEEAEAIAGHPPGSLLEVEQSWELLEIQEARVVDEDDDATP
jgi:hypothetical protein